jgi:putative hydrolase
MTDDNNNEQNPFEQIFGMLFGANGPGSGEGEDKNESGMPQGFQIDPSMMATIMNQMQGLFGQGADPQAQAVSIAQKAVPTPDPAVTDEAERATTDAFRLAELWLAEATEFSVANRSARPLRRTDWVKETMPGWQKFVLPIKENMSTALTETLESQVPAEMKGILAGAQSMFGSMSDSMFAMQIGQAVGALSESVLTGTEVGLPLLPHDTAVLVETNIEAFAADIDVDVSEVRIFLAAQELAHLALFERAPWLSAQVETVLTRYAQGLKVDTSQIEDMASNIDPSNISDLSDNIRQGLFNPPTTDDQKQALTSLENLSRRHRRLGRRRRLRGLQASARVATRSVRRCAVAARLLDRPRRPSPRSSACSSIPRRLRDAAALFAYLETQGGAEARDKVFSHPDLLPTTQDLDDPLGYSERRQAEWTNESSIDEALSRILAEGLDGAGGAGDSSETPSSEADTAADDDSKAESDSDDDDSTDDR